MLQTLHKSSGAVRRALVALVAALSLAGGLLATTADDAFARPCLDCPNDGDTSPGGRRRR
jgi:hypothetical protein